MNTRILFSIAMVGLAGCQCGGKVVGADSELVVEPASVDFGSVAPGTHRSMELVARVTGRLAIPIREVRIDQDSRGAFSSTAAEGTIEPGGELRFTVKYDAPGISGADDAVLVLVTNTEQVLVPLRAHVDVVFCEIAECGTRCGLQSDGCGGTLDCGMCNAMCVPKTCTELSAACGSVSDGCGAMLDCGTCSGGASCQNNQCVTTCVPQTCAGLSAMCGSIGDGCGGTLSCGACGPGAMCAQNQCTCASSGNELCGDGVDNDCDGAVDCSDSQCASDPACMQPACTVTSAELQVTNSAVGAGSGFLSWTGTEWGHFSQDESASAMRYLYQRISAQGQLVGSSTDVTGGGVAHRPFAAWTGNEFGLAWSDVRNTTQQNDVFFNRVTPSGQRMLSSNVDISARPGLAFPSSIAWNPTAQEFGILWGDDRVAGPGNDRALFFRRVDVMGNLAGAEVQLTPAPTAGVTTDYSDITWGGANWGIVATQQRSGTPFMLFNRLSATGVPELSDLQLNASGRGAYNPRIASNSTHYAVVFHEYDSGFTRTDVVFTLISKSGAANPQRVVLTASGTAGNPTVVWTGSSWAVVYEDGRTGMRRLYYAKLDGAGARLVPDALLSCVTAGALMPHVAFNGTQLGVTWASLVAGKYQSFLKTFSP